MMNKNLQIKNILGVIQNIASTFYQERAWIKGEIHWPTTLEELYSQLFDDCAVREFIQTSAKKHNLSHEKIKSLKTFVEAFEEFEYRSDIQSDLNPSYIDSEKVIVNPHWQHIKELAAVVLNTFGEIKYELKDKEWWLPYIISGVESLANAREQKSKWTNNNGKAFYSTPKDMYEYLFIYNDFDIFIDKYANEFGCSKVQVEALTQLRSALKQADSLLAIEPTQLLTTPVWQNIQIIAYKTLLAFNEEKRVSFYTFWLRKLDNSRIRVLNRIRQWKYEHKTANHL